MSFSAIVVLCGASGASAQPVETVGTRALGMGGAFVGVADDSSATYWNPAGLALGTFFGASVDLGWSEWPSDEDGVSLAGGARTTFVGLATPPLGLSYLRQHEYGAAPPPPPGVPELGPTMTRLETHQVGVTFVQTVLPGVAVAATLKFVHGIAGDGIAPFATSLEDARELARDLPTRSENAFDLDLGVHAVAGRASFGLVARDLARPSFTTPSGGELALPRQVRLGAAFRPADPWLVAVDADLTVRRSVSGEWRRVAAGVERWFGDQRYALRGGVRVNTLGDATGAVTVGGSVGIRSGLWVEGQGAFSGSEAERGWSAGLRLGW